MRSLLYFIALAATLTTVSADVYPPCAIACIQAAVQGPARGSCADTDSRCLCSSAEYVSNVTTCIDCTCNKSDGDAAKATSRQVCHAVGVDLTSTAAPTATCPPGASLTFSQASATATKKSGALQTGVSAFAGAAALVVAGLAL